MASEKVTAMIEEVKGLTVLELAELVHDTIPESWDSILVRATAGYRAAERRRFDLDELPEEVAAIPS